MKLAGVICEYNPFHNGHEYHINKTKSTVGQDCAVICVMSGDFVQRGEPAAFPKHVRAEAAVRSGADLVLELPLPWAIASAEGFARGSVGILGLLNCVDYLSFGCECNDINILNALAVALIDPSLDALIRNELDSGISYAAARHKALKSQIGDLADHLESPNNILAVEYLKAIFDQHLKLQPIAIKREGAGHDQAGGSASDIRNLIMKGKNFSHYMPKEAYKVYKREAELARGPVTVDLLEDLAIARLRMLSPHDFETLPDVSEGLHNRIYEAVNEEYTIDGILSAVKSKRYALSRIRRIVMCAALGVKGSYAQSFPPYARVLAANETGRKALAIIKEKAQIPIITKPAEINAFSGDCLNVFRLGSSAHDFYAMAFASKADHKGRSDWRTSPIMI